MAVMPGTIEASAVIVNATADKFLEATMDYSLSPYFVLHKAENGTCQFCGSGGLPCCTSGSPCNSSDLSCQNGICELCGFLEVDLPGNKRIYHVRRESKDREILPDEAVQVDSPGCFTLEDAA